MAAFGIILPEDVHEVGAKGFCGKYHCLAGRQGVGLGRFHIHVHFCEWVSLHIYRSVNVAAASLGVERGSLLCVAVCAVRPQPSGLDFFLRCSKIFWTSLNFPLVVEN